MDVPGSWILAFDKCLPLNKVVGILQIFRRIPKRALVGVLHLQLQRVYCLTKRINTNKKTNHVPGRPAGSRSGIIWSV